MRVVARGESRVCSFCRGEVVEAEASRCAGASCSGLYDPECWEECASRRGTCAILGCGSPSAWSPASSSRRLPRQAAKAAKKRAVGEPSLLGHVGASVVGAVGLLLSFFAAVGAAANLPHDWVALVGPIFFACIALSAALAWLTHRVGDALTNAVCQARDAVLRAGGAVVEQTQEAIERTEALSTLIHQAYGRFEEADRRQRRPRRPGSRAA